MKCCIQMESELSAHRLPDFPILSQGADPAVSQGGLGFGPTFLGNAHSAESGAGGRTSQHQEPAFLYKFGNLEFLQQRNSLFYKTLLLVQPTCAQQGI